MGLVYLHHITTAHNAVLCFTPSSIYPFTHPLPSQFYTVIVNQNYPTHPDRPRTISIDRKIVIEIFIIRAVYENNRRAEIYRCAQNIPKTIAP